MVIGLPGDMKEHPAIKLLSGSMRCPAKCGREGQDSFDRAGEADVLCRRVGLLRRLMHEHPDHVVAQDDRPDLAPELQGQIPQLRKPRETI